MCGNVLAHRKDKKACFIYATWKELGLFTRFSHRWLPVGILQTAQAKKMQGGLTAAMPQLVAHFLSFSGRSIDVGDATLRLGSRFRLVVDGEALRSTFRVKGAAGTRPCPHCRNVVLREAYRPNETFATISEHRTASFRPTQDASL